MSDRPSHNGLSKEDLLQVVLESAIDFAIFTVDSNGLVTGWNIGVARVFGYSEQEIIGSSGDKIFTPEDRDARVPEIERRQALSEGRAADERWHQRKDGSRFWASGLLMPCLGSSNGFVKIARSD